MPPIPTFIPSLVVGIILVLLGASFGYKFVRACVFGKVNYWQGFLPISIFSPLFIHTPPPPSPPVGLTTAAKRAAEEAAKRKRSLIREATGLWVHLIMGPIFLVLAVLFLAAGCDWLGLPGTDTLNFILNGGNRLAPLAVTYDKQYTFRFPVLTRAAKHFGARFDKAQIPLPDDKKLLDTPESRANGR